MKASRLQSSLRDLNQDIGNCERQLSRVLHVKESAAETGRSRSVARNPSTKAGYRQPTVAHLTKTLSKQTNDTRKIRKRSKSPNKDPYEEDRDVIRKEIIGSRGSPTRVEVVVRTKSSKRRSRSVQSDWHENEVPTRDHPSKNRNDLKNHTPSTRRKNASWAHIFQQQSSSTCNTNRNGQARRRVRTALHYSSTDDDHSSVELERWVQSVPHGKERINHESSYNAINGNNRTTDVKDSHYSTFNPLRTLDFLMKELRGKVHENNDENMQRIVNDMEKALFRIPGGNSYASPPTKLAASEQHRPSRPRNPRPSSGEYDQIHNKEKVMVSHIDQKDAHSDLSPNLVNRLLTTVLRLSKITGFSEQDIEEPQSTFQKTKQAEIKSSPVILGSESPQAQLEFGCKQLEETCRQMRESYESLKQQNTQLLNELKLKSQQLETVIGKNQQLTLYAADIRQEMLRSQQTSEVAQQDFEKVKQKLLNQQHELQNSNCHLNRRLEETLQENERLATELQLCRLEKDKMYILMSNKDVEVAKLKKEIIDINTLVAEQLLNIRSISGKKYVSDELSKMMQAFSRLHETVDGTNTSHEQKMKNHVGDGEGSRSRPICSSPTSSVNSSLSSSWQLMSDITATDVNPNNLKNEDGSGDQIYHFSKENVFRKEKDSGINSATPVDNLMRESTSRMDNAVIDKADGSEKTQESAKELKAGLHSMFQLLKKQTSEAVNTSITLPSPPGVHDKLQETLGMSQWTELSASESTVLFHSSDESDSDGVS